MRLKIKEGRACIQGASKFATAEELAKAIEVAIRKSFPRSFLQVWVEMRGIGGPAINLNFAVAGSKAECPNNIWHNDISLTRGTIYGVDAEGNLKPKLEWDPALGGKIKVKPEPGSHYAFDSVKVGLRKKKGTPEQVIKHLDTYFKKLAKTLKENADRIPENNKILLKSVQL